MVCRELTGSLPMPQSFRLPEVGVTVASVRDLDGLVQSSAASSIRVAGWDEPCSASELPQAGRAVLDRVNYHYAYVPALLEDREPRLVLFYERQDPAHRHADHRAWAEADPGKLVAWAQSVGPATALLMQRILGRSPFPEQAWRSGRGLKRVGMKYPQRIEVAAERALRFGATSYKPVDRMLRLGLDQRPLPGEDGSPDAKTPQHANVRGPSYYH